MFDGERVECFETSDPFALRVVRIEHFVTHRKNAFQATFAVVFRDRENTWRPAQRHQVGHLSLRRRGHQSRRRRGAALQSYRLEILPFSDGQQLAVRVQNTESGHADESDGRVSLLRPGALRSSECHYRRLENVSEQGSFSSFVVIYRLNETGIEHILDPWPEAPST